MAVRAEIDERLVAELWERQAFDRDELRRLGLSVIFRGVPSDAGGPDYQDAILAWDGGIVSGDIELHVAAADWYRHGHSTDKRYNGVILHVVWQAGDVQTVREDGTAVPTLELAGAARLATIRPPDPTTSLVRHPCITHFESFSTPELERTVADLGWRRFQELEDRFAAELESLAPDQVIYAALMEGLGYASNRQVFRALADAVPIAWLLSVSAPQRTTTLLDAAGLGPPSIPQPPSRLPPNGWRLSRLRPSNHPARRIAGIVELLNCLGSPPADSLTAAVQTALKPAHLRRTLVARLAESSGIGAGRADELAVSVVLPFVSALDPVAGGARTLYATYPAPPATRWTRTMLKLLAEAGHPVAANTALRHQGLHLLYTRYCRREGPADCPVCHGARVGVQDRR